MISGTISTFTPSLTSPETLEAMFVQRHDLADELVELVRDSASGPQKQHTLLIGPRGIGKTHLLTLVINRVRKDDELSKKVLVAWLREEEWGVATFLDLLIRILRAVRFDVQGQEVEGRIDDLFEYSPEVAEREAVKLVREINGDRTLLLAMENLDELFDGLGSEGQHRFRSFLQQDPMVAIIATSQALFGAVSLQKSPFYGFFRIRHLEKLTFEEALYLVQGLARLRCDDELVAELSTAKGRARMRAIHHLAGGTHRIYVIFAHFLTCSNLSQLIEPFIKMLDDLTPFYQSRMAMVSNQQRKILEYLCDYGGAAPVKQIAKMTFISSQTASSQLKQLKDRGFVVLHKRGNEGFYELRESLMRLSVELKRNRGEPISLVVNLLCNWFTEAELKQMSPGVPIGTSEADYIQASLRMVTSRAFNPAVDACMPYLIQSLIEGNTDRLRDIMQEIGAMRGQELNTNSDITAFSCSLSLAVIWGEEADIPQMLSPILRRNDATEILLLMMNVIFLSLEFHNGNPDEIHMLNERITLTLQCLEPLPRVIIPVTCLAHQIIQAESPPLDSIEFVYHLLSQDVFGELGKSAIETYIRPFMKFSKGDEDALLTLPAEIRSFIQEKGSFPH